ncbi:hypothetical protein V1508DRAFT_407112 [Lipomyces doorenjongii]|uniref:uncharacterized protein n=1 Tax=Lipomyces doorenjongii TaxID=383834 RepID=UPI0034CECB39
MALDVLSIPAMSAEPERLFSIRKGFFDCHGLLHIILSKDGGSQGHTETPKVHVTDEVRRYIDAHKLLSLRQIYQNLVRMADDYQFEKRDLSTITRQQVLIREQDGYQLVEDLQEPGVSLAFVTPCLSDTLYCVLTEYDLVSLPLSYLLLDTRGIREDGKRGSKLTAWFTALRDAGLNPNVVHTDKHFAELTAARLAFKRNNPACKHHLCLKTKNNGAHSVENARNSIRKGALPEYLHFLSDESEWILSNEHPLPKVVGDFVKHPRALVYETYEGIPASAIREMLDYCGSVGQPKVFRYLWINWYRPEYAQVEVGDCFYVWATWVGCHNPNFAYHDAT